MRTAVVTGAGSGLGRAIAAELAGRGWRVHVTDVDAGAADRGAAELGGEARASALDVRDEAACRALAESLGRTNSLDLWVNNAGVFFSGVPWEQSAEVRQTMLDVNATGLMNGTVAALGPMLREGRGHIINVCSLAAIVAAPGEVAYSASKHAAIAFTLGTLFDLHRRGVKGIHLSAVCPDGIWTPMLEDKLDDLDAAPSFSGRLLTAEEVAKEVGALTEKPRPILIVPRWRSPMLRFFDVFPRFGLRILPLIMWDARRRQRGYKRRIKSGRWPRRGPDVARQGRRESE